MEIETVRTTSGRAATRAVGRHSPDGSGVTYGRLLLVPSRPARGQPRLATDERRVLAVIRTATGGGEPVQVSHLARVCHLTSSETRRIVEKLHALTIIEPVGDVKQPRYRIVPHREQSA